MRVGLSGGRLSSHQQMPLVTDCVHAATGRQPALGACRQDEQLGRPTVRRECCARPLGSDVASRLQPAKGRMRLRHARAPVQRGAPRQRTRKRQEFSWRQLPAARSHGAGLPAPCEPPARISAPISFSRAPAIIEGVEKSQQGGRQKRGRARPGGGGAAERGGYAPRSEAEWPCAEVRRQVGATPVGAFATL